MEQKNHFPFAYTAKHTLSDIFQCNCSISQVKRKYKLYFNPGILSENWGCLVTIETIFVKSIYIWNNRKSIIINQHAMSNVSHLFWWILLFILFINWLCFLLLLLLKHCAARWITFHYLDEIGIQIWGRSKSSSGTFKN